MLLKKHLYYQNDRLLPLYQEGLESWAGRPLFMQLQSILIQHHLTQAEFVRSRLSQTGLLRVFQYLTLGYNAAYRYIFTRTR